MGDDDDARYCDSIRIGVCFRCMAVHRQCCTGILTSSPLLIDNQSSRRKLIAGGDDSTSIAFEICDEVCGMFPPQERVTYYRPPMGEGTANLLEDMDPEKGDKNPSGSGGAPAAKAAGGASADSSKQKAKKEKSKKSKAKAAAPPPSGGMGGRPDMNMKQPDLSHLTPEQRAKYEVTGPGGKKGYYVDQDGNPLEMDPMFMNMPHVGPNGEQLGPGGPPPGGPMGGPPGGGAFPPPPPPPGAGKKTKKGAKKGGNKKKAGKKDAAAAPTEGGAKSGGKASDEL